MLYDYPFFHDCMEMERKTANGFICKYRNVFFYVLIVRGGGGEFFELIVYEYLQKCVFDVLLPRALLEEVNVAVDGHVGQLFLLHRGEVRGAIPQGLLQVWHHFLYTAVLGKARYTPQEWRLLKIFKFSIIFKAYSNTLIQYFMT